jgi:hypothetical protein
MVNVTDGADVDVGLVTLELLLGHDARSVLDVGADGAGRFQK